MCSGLDRYIYFVILQLSCIDAFYHSADHNSSFSKRIQINHSSCSNHIIHVNIQEGENYSLIGTLGIYSWTILREFGKLPSWIHPPAPLNMKSYVANFFLQNFFKVSNLSQICNNCFLLDGTNLPRFLESHLV